MASTEIITIENDLAYQSKEIKEIVKTMWLGFYEKLDIYGYKTKIALWTITGDSQVFGVMPISPKPNKYEEAPFLFNTGVESFYPLVHELDKKLSTYKLNDDEYIGALTKLCSEFEAWISKSIISVWNSKEIQQIHKQSNFCTKRFGVYSINEQDIAPNELHLMKHLAGDKFQ